jgi:hypothetical protein
MIEHGYSGLDECSKVCHLLTEVQDNAVQPVVCKVLAMREEEQTFTTCSELFADFICHLKQNPSNMHRVAELGSSGRGGGRGRDAGGRGGGGCGHGSRGSLGSPSKGRCPDQSEFDKVTWLQANKYYTVKECTQFTATKKQWIHQHRTKSPAPKRKVAAVSRGDDYTAGESDDNGDLFGNHNNKSILSKHSTWSNLTSPALVCQEKKTMHRK